MLKWLGRVLSQAIPARPPKDPARYEELKEKGALHLNVEQFDDAIACFERALELRPDLPEAHFNLGVAYKGAGRLDQALARYQHALTLQPDFAAALCNASVVLKAFGKLRESIDYLRRAIAARPGLADAHYNLGAVMLELGDADQAADCFRAAAAAQPDHGEALFHLGVLARQQGSLVESAGYFRRFVEAHSERADAHWMLGSVLLEQGKPELAAAHLRSALALRHDFAEAHADLGLALFAQGNFLQAEISCRAALALKPDLVPAHVNLGLVLEHGFGNPDEAINCFREALRLQPDHVDANANLGTACQELGRLDEAAEHFELALRLAPENANANMARAVLNLLRGRFEDGWQQYEWRRPQAQEIHRRFTFPAWDGSPLAGRSILIYAEQGIGDQIMFASCLPEVIAQARHCVIECSSKLGPIFHRSFPAAAVHGGTEDAPSDWLAAADRVELQLPVGSLPRFFRRTLQEFPRHGGYLRADPAKVRKWRARLDALGGATKVGISWRGGMPMSGTVRRSLDLECLLPILRVRDTCFIDLQYTDCREESEGLAARHGIRVHRWPEAIEDYDDTAALVCALDLTVSVCTALVHLGGALGRPVWVMAPFCPEWRYGFRGETMPWYPSVRIFRQPEYGRWDPVIETVAARLAQLICGR